MFLFKKKTDISVPKEPGAPPASNAINTPEVSSISTPAPTPTPPTTTHETPSSMSLFGGLTQPEPTQSDTESHSAFSFVSQNEETTTHTEENRYESEHYYDKSNGEVSLHQHSESGSAFNFLTPSQANDQPAPSLSFSFINSSSNEHESNQNSHLSGMGHSFDDDDTASTSSDNLYQSSRVNPTVIIATKPDGVKKAERIRPGVAAADRKKKKPAAFRPGFMGESNDSNLVQHHEQQQQQQQEQQQQQVDVIQQRSRKDSENQIQTKPRGVSVDQNAPKRTSFSSSLPESSSSEVKRQSFSSEQQQQQRSKVIEDDVYSPENEQQQQQQQQQLQQRQSSGSGFSFLSSSSQINEQEDNFQQQQQEYQQLQLQQQQKQQEEEKIQSYNDKQQQEQQQQREKELIEEKIKQKLKQEEEEKKRKEEEEKKRKEEEKQKEKEEKKRKEEEKQKLEEMTNEKIIEHIQNQKKSCSISIINIRSSNSKLLSQIHETKANLSKYESAQSEASEKEEFEKAADLQTEIDKCTLSIERSEKQFQENQKKIESLEIMLRDYSSQELSARQKLLISLQNDINKQKSLVEDLDKVINEESNKQNELFKNEEERLYTIISSYEEEYSSIEQERSKVNENKLHDTQTLRNEKSELETSRKSTEEEIERLLQLLEEKKTCLRDIEQRMAELSVSISKTEKKFEPKLKSLSLRQEANDSVKNKCLQEKELLSNQKRDWDQKLSKEQQRLRQESEKVEYLTQTEKKTLKELKRAEKINNTEADLYSHCFEKLSQVNEIRKKVEEINTNLQNSKSNLLKLTRDSTKLKEVQNDLQSRIDIGKKKEEQFEEKKQVAVRGRDFKTAAQIQNSLKEIREERDAFQSELSSMSDSIENIEKSILETLKEQNDLSLNYQKLEQELIKTQIEYFESHKSRLSYDLHRSTRSSDFENAEILQLEINEIKQQIKILCEKANIKYIDKPDIDWPLSDDEDNVKNEINNYKNDTDDDDDNKQKNVVNVNVEQKVEVEEMNPPVAVVVVEDEQQQQQENEEKLNETVLLQNEENTTEAVVQLSEEEINKKVQELEAQIEVAVSEENYILADSLDAEVQKLKSRLQNAC